MFEELFKIPSNIRNIIIVHDMNHTLTKSRDSKTRSLQSVFGCSFAYLFNRYSGNPFYLLRWEKLLLQ